MKPTRFPIVIDVAAAVFLAYLTGFIIVLATVGPWEATRQFAVEGLILAGWLGIGHSLLRDFPAETLAIKKPAVELVLGGVGFTLLVALAAAYYLGVDFARWAVYVLDYGIPIVVSIALGYGVKAMGLSAAPRRAWAAVLAIILVNFGAGFVFGQLLPPGELPANPSADLSEQLGSVQDVVVEIGRIIVVAAIPEELFFRVYLQPRLAHYLPLRWAIVVQALLFSVIHLPQQIISFGYSWPLALAGVLTISNGVIGGYLWSRTRSLPLLIVLHLFAYPRIGL
jgi:membrane protease YdiL (CAAX protease family)